MNSSRIAHIYLDMEETGPRNVCNWRSNLLSSVDDIHTECIDCISANIIPVYSGYQHLTLMVVHEQPTNHYSPILFSLGFLGYSEIIALLF